MPAISNPKWESFVREVHKGTDGGHAYLAAVYETTLAAAAVSASRLLRNPKIIDRLAELRADRDKVDAMALEMAAGALSIDRQWVLAKLKDNYERASQAVPVTDREGEPIGEFKYEGSVANRALELIGKELGMFIERTENTTTVKTISPDPLTPEEWSEQHATSH